jgi:hypothetical protein
MNGVSYLCSGIRTKIQKGDIIVASREGKTCSVAVFRPATNSWLVPILVFFDSAALSVSVIMRYVEMWGSIKRTKTHNYFKGKDVESDDVTVESYVVL